MAIFIVIAIFSLLVISALGYCFFKFHHTDPAIQIIGGHKLYSKLAKKD